MLSIWSGPKSCPVGIGSASQQSCYFKKSLQVLLGPVLKRRICDLRIIGLSFTGSTGFFVEVSMGKTFQSPWPSTSETQEIHEYVNSGHDMNEILL